MAKHYGHNDGVVRDTYVFHGYPRGFFRFTARKGFETVRIESFAPVSHRERHADSAGDAFPCVLQGFMSATGEYLRPSTLVPCPQPHNVY